MTNVQALLIGAGCYHQPQIYFTLLGRRSQAEHQPKLLEPEPPACHNTNICYHQYFHLFIAYCSQDLGSGHPLSISPPPLTSLDWGQVVSPSLNFIFCWVQ